MEETKKKCLWCGKSLRPDQSGFCSDDCSEFYNEYFEQDRPNVSVKRAKNE